MVTSHYKAKELFIFFTRLELLFEKKISIIPLCINRDIIIRGHVARWPSTEQKPHYHKPQCGNEGNKAFVAIGDFSSFKKCDEVKD